ncbi:putative ribonuclease H-like domain-containing protein [Tanacetum coccineum]
MVSQHVIVYRITYSNPRFKLPCPEKLPSLETNYRLLTFMSRLITLNKTHLTYGNCGMSRHTTDQCFELIGYPNWWNDGHKKGNKNGGLERGKASAANTGTDRKNPTGLGGMAETTVNEEDGSFSMSTTQNYNINQKQSWIFDCRATDTMTYDFSQTGAIIGRGTERQGLYYVDELTTSGTVMLAHGTSEKEAWLWHRRLGHPSGGKNHSTQNESPFSIQPEDPKLSDAQEAPNLIPEVSNTHSSPMSEPIETTNNTSGQGESIQEQEMFATQNDTNVEQNEHMKEQVNFPTQEDTSGRYVLPPRATRGEAKVFALSMYSDEIPANSEQALKSKHWKDAMEEEIKALIKNNTWEKRVLPPRKKTVGCRVLISIAANKGWPLHQFDVNNAFLHGELKEEIYMEAPHGFTDSFGEKEVCLLQKSLYGLKQSPRAWFGRFTLAMKHYGFKQRNDKEEITKLKKNLFTEFEMKDLGRLKYFLGIEVLRSKQGIFMYQKKYVLDLLAEIGMVDCKPADTPMIVNQKLYMELTKEDTNEW